MRKAANKGIGWARMELCDILWSKNTSESLAEMISIISKPAESGNPDCMARLARAYRDGRGVDRNPELAEDLMRKAANKGIGWARMELMNSAISNGFIEFGDCKFDFYLNNLEYQRDIVDYLTVAINKTVWQDLFWRIRERLSNNALSLVVFPNFIGGIGSAKSDNMGMVWVLHDNKIRCHIHYFASLSSGEKLICICNNATLINDMDNVFLINHFDDIFSIELTANKGIDLITSVSGGLIETEHCICTNFNKINHVISSTGLYPGFKQYYLNNLDFLPKRCVEKIKLKSVGDRTVADFIVNNRTDCEIYNFVTCSSNTFVNPIFVLIHSIYVNCKRPARLWVMQSDFDEIQKKYLKDYSESLGISLMLIDVDPHLFKKLDTGGNWPRSSFYYLLAHQYLPDEVERALYLDPDTLVLKDVFDLYSIDFEDCYICGCNEGRGSMTVHNSRPDEFTYYNGGVILMNLSKLRSDNISMASYEAIFENNLIKIGSADQPLLNYMFWKKSKMLPNAYYNAFPQWTDAYLVNYFNIGENTSEAYAMYEFDRDKLDTIVHFAGGMKPWAIAHMTFVDGSTFTLGDLNAPQRDEYIRLWWEYSKNIPEAIIKKLHEDRKIIGGTSGLDKMKCLMISKKSKYYSWIHDFLISNCCRNGQYSDAIQLYNNIPDCVEKKNLDLKYGLTSKMNLEG